MNRHEFAGFESRVRRRIPRRLRSKFEPADVFQEVAIRLHPHAEVLDSLGAVGRQVYILKVFATTLTDLIRFYERAGRRVDRERPLDGGADDSAGGFASGLAAEITSPSQRAARRELLWRLEEALAGLPEDQRRVITLHHIEGLSLDETAKRMGKSFASVAGLLRRGLQALRRRLQDEARP